MNWDGHFVDCILRGTNKCKNHTKIYHNTPNCRQASVAVILRSNIASKPRDIKQLMHMTRSAEFAISILFCQRAHNPRDLHSDQLCFPGGKLDEGENDYQAAIRETIEEVGLDIFQGYYLGRLPNNFNIRGEGRKPTRMCAHVFLMFGECELRLNESEIQAYKWIPLRELNELENKISITEVGPSYGRYMIQFVTNNYPKITDQLIKQFDYAYMAKVDIGMGQHLYGFTYFILVQLILLATSQMQDSNEYMGLRVLTDCVQIYQMRFKNDNIIGYLGNRYFSGMYRKQSIYERVQVNKYLARL